MQFGKTVDAPTPLLALEPSVKTFFAQSELQFEPRSRHRRELGDCDIFIPT